jgi:hypothetical protein
MAWGATILRLAAAACVSSLAAGLLMVLFLLSGPFLDPRPLWDPAASPPLERMLWTLRFGLEGAFLLTALPAFVAGAAMSALGRRHEAARPARAWASAGACVGALFWLAAQAAAGIDPFDLRMSSLEVASFAAFLVAGAGAALAFQAVMWISAPFDPLSRENQEAGE